MEDNHTNLLLATKMLEKLGCKVVSAGNGQSAISVLEQQSFDLVLMDCEMPIMNGLDATREIRSKSAPYSSIPIIALTAHVTHENSATCLAVGMNDFLSKPISLANLKGLLEKWIPWGTFILPTPIGSKTALPPGSSGSSPSGKIIGEIPLLDLNVIQGLRETGGKTLLKTLLGGFSQQAPEIIQEIKQGLGNKDFEKIRRATHRLKGSCLSFGARRMAEQCRIIETHSLLEDWKAIAPRIDSLELLLSTSLEEFARILSQFTD